MDGASLTVAEVVYAVSAPDLNTVCGIAPYCLSKLRVLPSSTDLFLPPASAWFLLLPHIAVQSSSQVDAAC